MQYTNPHFIISTFFGLGKLSSRMPGTIGSLAAFPLAFYCFKLSSIIRQFFQFNNPIIDAIAIPLICVFILFIIGTISSTRYARYIAKNDPKEIVIDEIVGQMLCIILSIPLSILFFQVNLSKQPFDLWFCGMLLGNFILFRIFDILKPWPINWCEKKFTGGFGIMIDDIMAAIFALVIYFAIFLNLIDYLK